jgi:hypothetical protein
MAADYRLLVLLSFAAKERSLRGALKGGFESRTSETTRVQRGYTPPEKAGLDFRPLHSNY